MKKSKVIETHGQDESQAQTKPTLLEQVWGSSDLSKYGTLDETEYTRQINNMTRAELENHARRMGVIIVENSARLRDKLLKEFASYVSLLRKPVSSAPNQRPISEAAQKILNEGR